LSVAIAALEVALVLTKSGERMRLLTTADTDRDGYKLAGATKKGGNAILK